VQLHLQQRSETAGSSREPRLDGAHVRRVSDDGRIEMMPLAPGPSSESSREGTHRRLGADGAGYGDLGILDDADGAGNGIAAMTSRLGLMSGWRFEARSALAYRCSIFCA
jgi:hypothetical protein